jgi:hypothetical protein
VPIEVHPLNEDDTDNTDVDPVPPEVTAKHDGGEWLAGFNQGVEAGRKDVIQALKVILGDSPMAQDIEIRVLEALIDPGG